MEVTTKSGGTTEFFTVPKADGKLHWYRKARSCTMFMNPMFITFIILQIIFAFIIYWYNFRPNWYIKIYEKLLQFQGFKYSHIQKAKLRTELRKNAGRRKNLQTPTVTF